MHRDRVIFTSHIMEYPAAGGPQLRILNSIRALASIVQLHIINRDINTTEEGNQYFSSLADSYSTIVSRAIQNNRMAHVSRTKYIYQRIKSRIFNEVERAHAEYIIRQIDERSITIVWFGYGNISYPIIKYIKKMRPTVQLVCDTDSVWSRFIKREAPFTNFIRRFKVRWKAYLKEREERKSVNLCEVTTAVSLVDAEYYIGIADTCKKVHIFSNVIEVDEYNSDVPAPSGYCVPSLYLAGTFGHKNSPMDLAAKWIIEDVFPIVQRSHPKVHLYIVGRESDKSFGHINNPNITVTGRIDSVLPYLSNADVSLVPLMFESGTRFKILEAGACAVPIVSTTLGAEGLPVINGEHILIADTTDEFALAINKVIEDNKLSERLAVNCKAMVGQFFSIQAATQEAQKILRYLAKLRENKL